MQEDNDDFELCFYSFFLFWTNNGPNTSLLSTDPKVLYKGNKHLCPLYKKGNGITKEKVFCLPNSRVGNTDSTLLTRRVAPPTCSLQWSHFYCQANLCLTFFGFLLGRNSCKSCLDLSDPLISSSPPFSTHTFPVSLHAAVEVPLGWTYGLCYQRFFFQASFLCIGSGV